MRRMEESIFLRDRQQIAFLWRKCKEKRNDDRITSLKILHTRSYSKIHSNLSCVMREQDVSTNQFCRQTERDLRKSVLNANYKKKN
jgi:hypothetical protein